MASGDGLPYDIGQTVGGTLNYWRLLLLHCLTAPIRLRLSPRMRIYFMGVCGTAMGNAALLARASGHEVSGSDTAVYPPMSNVLAASGIAVHEGYDPARLAALAPDLVVIGNAMSRGNPEVEWLLDTRALPFTSLPGLLYDAILSRRANIVVAGTHGKTTTTALTAFLLREAGSDPGFLIGGVPQDPPVGAHLGAPGAPFVIEGDEYDSAFFDKRSKFIHYAPRIAILGNLEFDHADIFRDLADIQRTFLHLARLVPRGGFILVNGEDDALRELGAFPWTRVVRVGTGPHNDTRVVDFAETPAGVSFRLLWRGEPWGEVRWALPGLFNARNAAMAATAAGLALATGGFPAPGAFPIGSPAAAPDGPAGSPPGAVGAAAAGPSPGSALAPVPSPTGLSLSPLARFRGVRRRQEALVSGPRLTVIEDFGHHPTAIAGTLESFRGRFPGARLTAVFEPRSNTARTKALQPAFAQALAGADEVFIGAVNRADKLGEAERFDGAAVTAHLASRGVAASAHARNEDLLHALAAATLVSVGATSRVVVFFSNGSFDGIIARYAALARTAGN